MALSREEIRTLPNLWPLVAAEMGGAIKRSQALILRPPDDLVRSLVVRFEMGEKMYGRDFVDWSEEQFEQEIRCEVADVILYNAIKRVMYGG